MKPVIIVHGGASKIRDEFVDGYLKGIQEAAHAGFKVFEHSGSSVDAVEAAVRCMEDNPFFNAGESSCCLSYIISWTMDRQML
jgi:beta-aspartyl-peptidase (threonine type)